MTELEKALNIVVSTVADFQPEIDKFSVELAQRVVKTCKEKKLDLVNKNSVIMSTSLRAFYRIYESEVHHAVRLALIKQLLLEVNRQ